MANNATVFLVYLITALLGGGATYFLQSKRDINKVQSSAIATFLFSTTIYFVVKWFSLPIDSTHLMSIFWGASFAGMSSSKVVNWTMILLASTLFLALFEIAINIDKTHGGKLGLIAAIASITSLAVIKIVSKMGSFLR